MASRRPVVVGERKETRHLAWSHELDVPIWEGRASKASAQWAGKCRGGGQAHKRLEREGGSIDGHTKKKEIGKKKKRKNKMEKASQWL